MQEAHATTSMHPGALPLLNGGKRDHGARGQKRLLVCAAVATAAGALLLFLLLAGALQMAPTTTDGSSGRQAARAEQHLLAQFATTDACMPLLPPFEPACVAVSSDERELIGCPVLACSLAANCTTHDPHCCAYVHLQMLLFLDVYLTANGLEGEYMLVYGTALGAHRNTTILPHTNDVDIALSPRGLLFLEQNATRAELFSYGYIAWGFKWNRRLCPHSHHPSPEFRSLMQPLDGPGHQAYLDRTGAYSPGFIDIWPMWVVPATTRNCEAERVFRSHADALASALAPLPRQQPGVHTTWCITFARAPVVLAAGRRGAVIDGHTFPGPEDPASHLAATYGAWQRPLTSWHGKSCVTRDGNTLRDALLEWLSANEWGGMPWAERRRRCAEHDADFDYWLN